MSITFGSVGDIVAVGQITWSLAQALKDSTGSAKEYQSLIKELQRFDQALLQVVALWQNYDESPELSELGKITKHAVKDWRDILLAFRVKVDKKYGVSLGAGGSGSWVKDAGKKIVWLKEKEDILDLRRELSSASDMIILLTLAAIGKSNRLAESAIAFRVQLVHYMLEEFKTLAEEHNAKLKKLEEKIDSQSKATDLILNHLKSGIPALTHVQSSTVEVRNLLGVLRSHIMFQQSTPRGLGTCWQQDPIILEDALGFRIPLPLELVTSWEMLDVILVKRFEKRPGHEKILNGEFAIEEGISGKDVSREVEFALCLCPGQKIDMSMVFADLDANSNHCPRCGTKSEALAEARTQCNFCHMWFRRVTEIDDESEPEPTTEHERLSTGVHNNFGSKKSKACVSIPADFQRVRLMSILRLREQKAEEERDKAYMKQIEDMHSILTNRVDGASDFSTMTVQELFDDNTASVRNTPISRQHGGGMDWSSDDQFYGAPPLDLGRRSSGNTIGDEGADAEYQTANGLRKAKSFGDLCSYTPSPVPSPPVSWGSNWNSNDDNILGSLPLVAWGSAPSVNASC